MGGSLWAGGRGAYRCGARQFIGDGPEKPGQPVRGGFFCRPGQCGRPGQREFIRDSAEERHASAG